MAVFKKHSFDDNKIKRYKIDKNIKDGVIMNLRTESDIGSYFNAIGNGAIRDYDGENLFAVRIDPYTASIVGSSIGTRRANFI